MQTLTEKYRPREWLDVLGQSKAVKRLQRFEADNRLAGRAYWITGASGVGKTTIAEIIASKIADEMNIHRYMVHEVTAQTVSRWRDMARMIPLGTKRGTAIIVNECHGLRKDAIRALKDLLEAVSPHVALLFTTTRDEGAKLFDDDDGENAIPFRDRCTVVSLTNQGLNKVFAQRALEIARAEGLDGKLLPAYEKLIRECKNSMRAALYKIENYEMLD